MKSSFALVIVAPLLLTACESGSLLGGGEVPQGPTTLGDSSGQTPASPANGAPDSAAAAGDSGANHSIPAPAPDSSTPAPDPAAPDSGPLPPAPDAGSVPPPVTYDVVIAVGDSFQQKNDSSPAGTVFLVEAGVHVQQRIDDPKDGNQWIGEPGAVMDGQGARSHAFGGSATDVEIRLIKIQGYQDNGIFFSGGSGVWVDQVTVYDTGSGDGEDNGSVRFDNMSDVKVTDCYFERVSSGVLPSHCSGPIVIEHNSGLNIGRNMVQLAWCSGGGIRVRYNSMDCDGAYVRPGNDHVEDWISVFAVQGLPNDYAEFSYNRARGHGTSDSGSFIMLGDGGGEYQRAVGNVGVTPGQVGIGLSGGHYIEATDNLMYSDSWAESNIAFYSADYGSGGCGNHIVRNNRASWTNRDGISNSFWAGGSCSPLDEGDNTFPDGSLTAAIWNQWNPSP